MTPDFSCILQTRAYFKSKYGTIADNPEVGKQLTEVCHQAPWNVRLTSVSCEANHPIHPDLQVRQEFQAFRQQQQDSG